MSGDSRADDRDHVAGPGHAPTPAPGSTRRGIPAWLVVLLTLGCVGAVVLAFVVGVVTGVWVAGRGTAVAVAPAPVADPATPQVPAEGDGPGAVAEPAESGAPADPGAASGGFDECLVGTWQTVEHSESYDTEQGAASITELDRTITFTADGGQTIGYDQSEGIITTDQGALPGVFDGEVTYNATTTGTTMSFELLSAEGTVTVLNPDGSVADEQPIQPGTGDVTYSCDETTFTQTATGYLSVYERAD